MKHTPSKEEKRAILDAVFTPLQREPPVVSLAAQWARLAGYLAAEAVKLNVHEELRETAADLNQWASMALRQALYGNNQKSLNGAE